MYKNHGFLRIGTIVPKIKVANIDFNATEIIHQIKKSAKENISIVTTPELSLTAYTCADLFHQEILIEESIEGLKKIIDETKNLDIISIIGLPLRHENQLFNAAVVIQKGKILGVVPKTYLPIYAEFYEQRWFTSASFIKKKEITILNQTVPFHPNILFQAQEDPNICFAIEICEDLWVTTPPSNYHALNGATIIFNPSASNEVIGKYEYRKNLVTMQSAKTISAYCYASSSTLESSTDLVFSGHAMIAENGTLLTENQRFDLDSNITYTDIDVAKLVNDRSRNKNFIPPLDDIIYDIVPIQIPQPPNDLKRTYEQYPFVPKDERKRAQRCQEIINIQASGLAKRLLHTNINKTVIGLSGGLDSTLAFLVIIKAYQKLNLPLKNIIAVTMPGFGTTDRTYQNAINLAKNSGATIREINIKPSCLQHFKDIGLDKEDRSITYENAQARERTQILMDIANQEGALVIGTGDLSELALGWCTYNGDHLSMYAVNNSIPKTLVRYLVKWLADKANPQSKTIIYDILDTPISPELLPPDEYGNIVQVTEESIGPYVLHDFFLYHFFRYGASPEKLYFIAKHTFQNNFSDEEIKKWLITFLKRFFSQQFKRSCLPDGPKVGTISFSPRGDLRMPSDAEVEIWIKKLRKY